MPDPTIPLQFQPTTPMPNIGQIAGEANALLQFRANQQQMQQQNALRQILGAPGAIDPMGNPTPEALSAVTAISPDTGIKLRQNMMAQQENLMRVDMLKSDLFAKKQGLVEGAYAPILEDYEEAIRGGQNPQQAQSAAAAALSEANQRLMDGGFLSPLDNRYLMKSFDPTRMRSYLAGSQRITQWRNQQIAQEKERRAGWQVMTDPGKLDASGRPTQFRYNAGTHEATTLDGQPYTPTGAAKVQAAGRDYSNPQIMEYTDADGKKVQVLAQQVKNTGQWVTADEKRSPLPAGAMPVKVPPPGSNAAMQAAVWDDVKNDPAFRDKPAGVQAEEVKHRMAIASGQLSSPEAQQNMAEMIASYQIPALQGWSLTRPEGQAVMGLVRKINPDYQATEYNNYNKTIAGFGVGKQGDTIRYINNAIQHIDVMQQASAALESGDVRLFNRLANQLGAEFGVAAPTTFDGLRQIVGTEIERAATGGVGAAVDRDRLIDALNKANSPEQLKDIFKNFKALFGGQAASLKAQYEGGTPDTPLFRGDGKFAFDRKLLPETRKELPGIDKSSPSAAPQLTDAQKAALPHPATVAEARKLAPGTQYVKPDGTVLTVPGTAQGTPPATQPTTTPPAQQSQAAPAIPPIPPGLPSGSMYSPSRKMWRDPSGKLYDAQGKPVI